MTLTEMLANKKREVEIIEGMLDGINRYNSVIITYNDDKFTVSKRDPLIILFETHSIIEADNVAQAVEKAFSHTIKADGAQVTHIG